jgi:hypothetical protein
VIVTLSGSGRDICSGKSCTVGRPTTTVSSAEPDWSVAWRDGPPSRPVLASDPKACRRRICRCWSCGS